jgi:hypothetical protein
MAESFVKTIKRDYVSWMPKPDVRTALQNLAIAFDHYNESHPHSAETAPKRGLCRDIVSVLVARERRIPSLEA